ncbi:MAG TPA: hypothetical protein PKG81_03140, partial [Candidatus Omnitrophota bacterium]|nr:hypothetical protein [Candidatus Omnitrophota bacterium]
MFRKQTVKKILFVILILPVIFIIGAWLHDLFMIKIDTGLVDEYYDILSNVRYEGEGLALDLGCPEGTRPEIILERVKDVIGLPYGVIAGYHGADKPPAYIQNNNGLLTVYYSESLTKIKEIVNVTVHEMGHIYMWNVKKRFPSGFNEEKAVDVSGIYLGLGIQTLNGLTEGFFMTPGGSYHAEQKLFGYLSPEEFGYLLARYCRERNIDPENVFPFLNQTGKEYFGIGISYLERCGKIY